MTHRGDFFNDDYMLSPKIEILSSKNFETEDVISERPDRDHSEPRKSIETKQLMFRPILPKHLQTPVVDTKTDECDYFQMQCRLDSPPSRERKGFFGLFCS